MAGLTGVFFDTSAVASGVAGGGIYDANIAEVAKRAGARLVVTDNRRDCIALQRHGIRVLVSGELLVELDD